MFSTKNRCNCWILQMHQTVLDHILSKVLINKIFDKNVYAWSFLTIWDNGECFFCEQSMEAYTYSSLPLISDWSLRNTWWDCGSCGRCQADNPYRYWGWWYEGPGHSDIISHNTIGKITKKTNQWSLKCLGVLIDYLVYYLSKKN